MVGKNPKSWNLLASLCFVSLQAGNKPPSTLLEIVEDEAVNTLKARVSLILSEDGWSSRGPAASYWTKNSEPW
jgi:hypothetical protein